MTGFLKLVDETFVGEIVFREVETLDDRHARRTASGKKSRLVSTCPHSAAECKSESNQRANDCASSRLSHDVSPGGHQYAFVDASRQWEILSCCLFETLVLVPSGEVSTNSSSCQPASDARATGSESKSQREQMVPFEHSRIRPGIVHSRFAIADRKTQACAGGESIHVLIE